MHVYADSDAIYLAQAAVGGTELGELIGRRIEELEPYDLPDLGALIKVLVVEPDDDMTAVDGALGFPLLDRQCDVAQRHQDWFELTLVLSDDGFGVVLYVPRNADPTLLSYCHRATH